MQMIFNETIKNLADAWPPINGTVYSWGSTPTIEVRQLLSTAANAAKRILQIKEFPV